MKKTNKYQIQYQKGLNPSKLHQGNPLNLNTKIDKTKLERLIVLGPKPGEIWWYFWSAS